MSNQLEPLRTVVEDESLDIAARRAAAAHVVQLVVDGVPDPSDDDLEVVQLCTPWADQELAKLASEGTGGRSVNGWSLSDARQRVLTRLKVRAVLDIVVDEAAHKLIRLASCQTMLDTFMNPNGHYRRNAYTAERLLAAIIPAGSQKWVSGGRKEQVVRPPRDLGDVW